MKQKKTKTGSFRLVKYVRIKNWEGSKGAYLLKSFSRRALAVVNKWVQEKAEWLS